jgi:hypothetical protein
MIFSKDRYPSRNKIWDRLLRMMCFNGLDRPAGVGAAKAGSEAFFKRSSPGSRE